MNHIVIRFVFSAALVERLGEVCKSTVGAELTVHVKAKAEDGGQQMEQIIGALKEGSTDPVVGILSKVSNDTVSEENADMETWTMPILL